MHVLLLLVALAPCSAPCRAEPSAETAFTTGGHAKYQSFLQSYPDNSILRDLLGASSFDQALETRLRFAFLGDRWDLTADYQLIALNADTLAIGGALPASPRPLNSVISDDRRWWNLTYSFGDGDRSAVVHRLDRLSIGLTTERMAWRFGRQAISWGNGLVFTPMDVFNPFDPAAVDKEYKTGDDMLYGQYLYAGGNDVQGVAIVRRDPRSGRVEADQSSLAVKFHAFLGEREVDLLVAQHFDDQLLGFGGNINVGGAVWRGDLTWTRTDLQDVLSAVTSLSYSWTWAGKNVSGLIEYYHNGFGQSGSDYTLPGLSGNEDLLRRLERGELFTLGRHYLAASAAIEISPLFTLVPNLFTNLTDPSALLQLVAQYSIAQDLMFLGALNIPLGPDGSEYGGIAIRESQRYLSTGPGLFAQLAWYF